MNLKHNSFLIKKTIERKNTAGKIVDIDYDFDTASIVCVNKDHFPATPDKGELVVINGIMYIYELGPLGSLEWQPLMGSGGGGGGGIITASSTVFTPSNNIIWSSPPPTNVQQALDKLAEQNNQIPASRIIQDSTRQFVTAADKSNWTSGPIIATRVVQDTNHKFVTDAEKETWNTGPIIATRVVQDSTHMFITAVEKQKLVDLDNIIVDGGTIS